MWNKTLHTEILGLFQMGRRTRKFLSGLSLCALLRMDIHSAASFNDVNVAGQSVLAEARFLTCPGALNIRFHYPT